MTHLHISSIPDRVTIVPNEDPSRGLIRLSVVDDGVFGNVCDAQGCTTQRFDAQPAHLSIGLFRQDAAKLVREILPMLDAPDRAAILRAELGL